LQQVQCIFIISWKYSNKCRTAAAALIQGRGLLTFRPHVQRLIEGGAFLGVVLIRVNTVFTFLYYANEESDDIIGGFSKTAQHSIENNSRNIKAVFFKLGTRNAHHKRNRMTPTMLLLCKHSWLQSLSVKNQVSPFATF